MNQIEIIDKAINSKTVDEIKVLIREIGFKAFMWQKTFRKKIIFYDGMPDGFLEFYYGLKADKYCPNAWAVRKKLDVQFCFQDAVKFRNATSVNIEQSQKVWQMYGFIDGVVTLSGSNTFTAMVCNGDAKPILSKYKTAIYSISSRLDELLPMRKDLLTELSRDFLDLTDMQLKVLRSQLDHPALGTAEQAKLLGISPKTLRRHHERIAERFKVSNFTGAALLAKDTGDYSLESRNAKKSKSS